MTKGQININIQNSKLEHRNAACYHGGGDFWM